MDKPGAAPVRQPFILARKGHGRVTDKEEQAMKKALAFGLVVAWESGCSGTPLRTPTTGPDEGWAPDPPGCTEAPAMARVGWVKDRGRDARADPAGCTEARSWTRVQPMRAAPGETGR